jgi:hypothetical protein
LKENCDIWGVGNGLIIYGPAHTIRIQDCWIQACAAGDTGYHVDGIAYLNNRVPPTNVVIDHCAVASIGNTQGIGFQPPSSPYNGLTINDCYLSGFGYRCNPGTSFAGNTNVVVTNKIFGTDLPWLFASSDSYPRWTPSQNGFFVWPDGSFRAADWPR